MGMYDEVRAINIAHDNFDNSHNGLVFQTKCLESEMFEYCVFNNALYLQLERGGETGWTIHAPALKSDYSGTVNIYTDYTRDDVEYWIEYELELKDGEIIAVTAYDVRVTKDNRNTSKRSAVKPKNSVFVTIGVSNCDQEKQRAVADIIDNAKLDAIRKILNEPTATIYYPVQREDLSVSNMASIVQSVECASGIQNDSEPSNTASAKPSSNRVIAIDEYHSFSSNL